MYLNSALGFIALSGLSLQGYLDFIRRTSNILDVKSPKVWRYERKVSATHDRILDELSEDAKNLLFMLAFMNPDDIGEDILQFGHQFEDIIFLGDKAR